MTNQPIVPAAAQPALALARHDLGSRANVPDAQINTVSVVDATWADSSLGCPQPGFMYSQVVTPGYRVVLEAGGKSYEYHTDRGQRYVLCAKP